jgi:hypothetical protein
MRKRSVDSGAVRRLLALGLLVFAALTAASASAGPTVKRPQWRLSITGVQTLNWTMTSEFDGQGTCAIRHSGDQTIRFGTPRPLPARLFALDDVVFGAVLRAHVLIGGRYKGVVPIVGTEHRSYNVIQRPPAGICGSDARPYLQDCSGTKPLVKGAGMFVDTRPPKARAQKVATRVPVQTALLPRIFPDCPIQIFDLRNDWVYPLFTFGDWRPLKGGSPLSSRARRLTAHGSTSVCFADTYPSRHSSSCGEPHVAKIIIDWQVVLSR